MLPDLDWVSHVRQVKAFHTDRQERFGLSKSGRNNTGWSVRDTCRELGLSLGKVSEAIKLATALEDGTIHPNMTQSQALELVGKAIYLRLWACRYANLNKLYIRADNNVPYMFASKSACDTFIEKMQATVKLEPVYLSVTAGTKAIELLEENE